MPVLKHRGVRGTKVLTTQNGYHDPSYEVEWVSLELPKMQVQNGLGLLLH